jgi:hypothetical protein
MVLQEFAQQYLINIVIEFELYFTQCLSIHLRSIALDYLDIVEYTT